MKPNLNYIYSSNILNVFIIAIKMNNQIIDDPDIIYYLLLDIVKNSYSKNQAINKAKLLIGKN